MNPRGAGGDEPLKDSAALQELAAAVVHGVYRTVKACQFHTDVANDAVTSLTASAAAGVAEYCARAGTDAVSLAFLGDAVFVNRLIMKSSRDTHALAGELRALLETCDVTELTFSKSVDRSTISAFAKLLADVQRDRSLVGRLTSGDIPGVTAGKAKFAAVGASREESPGQRAARTYATSVLTVQGVFVELRAGKFELPRKIKRVAQQVVARADEDARLLVALAATGGVSLDAATVAVGSAILAVAMTRQLTTDRALLTNAAMAALLYDAGRVVLGGGGAGPQRMLNDDELDAIPARTVVALTALGRMHAPARARTALLYEVWSVRRAHRLGPLYKGRRPPTLLARIIGVARAFAELRGAGADGGLSIDDALQVLTTRASEGTDRALVKLLIGALGIYPAGTMVTLNTGELGVVMGTPTMPLDYVRPTVKILYDAQANLLETPIDLDLADAPPGAPPRFIARSVDADEQQMKAMRAFVIAATAAKRRGALDVEPAPRQASRAPVIEPREGRPTAPAMRAVSLDIDMHSLDATEPRPTSPVPSDVVSLDIDMQPGSDMLEARPTAPVPRSALGRPLSDGGMRSSGPVDEHLAAALRAGKPPSFGTSVPPAHRISTPVPIVVRQDPPRRRDPRNDSAPPSSMQDEIHRPVRIPKAARAPAAKAAPRPVPAPAPPPHAAEVSREESDSAETARPPPVAVASPPARDADEAPPSSRDDLLAAFLADAPIESIPPPVDPKKRS